MSLKNWINKIETSQLNEFAPPQGSVAVPGVQGQGQVSPTFLAPTNANDKATADLIKALANNKKITTIGQQQPAAGAKPTTPQQQPQAPQQTVAGTTMGAQDAGLQEDDLNEVAPPGMEDVVKALKKKFPGQEGKAYAIAWDQYNKKHGKTEESVMESKQLNESSLDEIIANHPHEHKMCQEGWGMDNSLFEALCDHYFKEGRIPRSVWHGPVEGLRKHVEECYTQDTMVVGEGFGGAVAGGTIGAVVGGPVGALRGASIGSEVQDMVSEKGMMESSEQSKRIEAHGVHGMKSKPWRKTFKSQEAFEKWFEKNEGNVEVHGTREIEESVAEGSKEDFTMNARQADPRLDKYATDPKKSFLDKASAALKNAGSAVMNKLHPSDEELRRGPLEETKEDEMYESNKSKKAVAETVTKSDKGLKHKADAGGYGRRHDGDEKPAKGAKKDSEDTGSKFDSSELTKAIGGKKPEKEVGKLSVKKRIKTKADREEVDEAIELGDNELGMPKWYIVDTNDQVCGGPFDSQDEARVSFKTSIWARSRWPDGRSEYDIAYGIEDDDGNFHEDERGVQESKKLKGKQSKLDKNKNGKVDGGDFKMMRDTQMESWDAQLKNLLTEGISLTTSMGNKGGQDSVSVTATDMDADKLLQILQNAGVGNGSINAAPAPAPAKSPTAPSTTATAPSSGSTGGPATDASVEGPATNVASMPMPRGMAFSVQPEETDIPSAPEEIGVVGSEDVISALGKEQGQSSKSDNGDDAMAFLKKAIGHGAGYATGEKETTSSTPATPSVSQAESDEEVEESDEDGKKPDEDGDGVPDWADKKEGDDDSEEDDSEEDDSEEDDSKESDEKETDSKESDEEDDSEEEDSEEEKVDEGKETCNECGGLMEDEHECAGQLNEWSNSPQGQSEDEQFKTDMEFMQNIISGGLNKKKADQTVMPHTKVKVTESSMTAQLRKLAGI